MSTNADKIYKLRAERGLTLEELAAKIGVSKSTIQKWETGSIKEMRRDKIQALADALGVSPEYFFDVPEQTEAYYTDDESRAMIEFLKNNHDYKVLFDAIRTIRPADIEEIKRFIEEKTNGN